MSLRILLFGLVLSWVGCSEGTDTAGKHSTQVADARFVDVPASATGIDFINTLEIDANFDVFRYRNYYNGGGVAIGDINNDGLADVYLTGNTVSNRLYLNQGDLRFEDITETSGTAGQKAWSTGVAMVDINADGWLDIYVCNSGDIDGDNRENELFINNQDGTFTESAAAYGIADGGFSTHAVFFDFDKDGDLDCYMLNNSFRPISTLNLRNLRNKRDTKGGDKLYRNDGQQFVDISEQAGIYGSVIGFGLGVTVGDVNGDAWSDIYVSNDFYERDYLYINQRDGTFSEELPTYMGHTSHFSMGADIGDINNDGHPEIFVTDMLAETLERTKETTSFLSYDEYLLRVRNGFHHQVMRNSLQLNNGDATFSEISQAVGVDATDWSWGAIIADLDNNGYKDIYVCNGIYKDVTDQDFVNFLANDENIRAAQMGEEIDFQKFVDRMPSRKVSNYLYANEGDLQLVNRTQEWGLYQPSHSNGAAYGDLDNDGDLDMIVNNVNAPANIWRNDTNQRDDAPPYLAFDLRNTGKNTFAVGTDIAIHRATEKISYQHMPMRGFQSSMDYRVVIGLGEAPLPDSIVLTNPYGEVIRLTGDEIKVDSLLTIRFTRAAGSYTKQRGNTNQASVFRSAEGQLFTEPPLHLENAFIDFDRDKMLYHMHSAEGPKLAVADINGDGYDDFYQCGAAEHEGQLYIYNTARQQYERQLVAAFAEDAGLEDTDATWADIDGDGDLDLLVASGGNEFLDQPELLEDRVYVNASQGTTLNFVRNAQALPRIRRVSSTIRVLDFDGDADMDVLVTTLINPKGYGLPSSSYLLQNDGQGTFSDVSARAAPVLRDIGMVSTAAVSDLNGDGAPDLVLAGDFMPITILYNTQSGFPQSGKQSIPNSEGMWKALRIADLDGDRQPDILAGNLGLNARFRGDTLAPFYLYVKDFDNNGSIEQVFARTENGKVYPMILRHDLGKVLPVINKRFNTYGDYKDKTVAEVFGNEAITEAIQHKAVHFATTMYLNRGGDRWEERALPLATQFSPVYGIAILDIDADGDSDILTGGNFYGTKPELGRYDASFGTVLVNDGKGNFRATDVPNYRTPGQVRDIQPVRLGQTGTFILVAKNSDRMQAFKLTSG